MTAVVDCSIVIRLLSNLDGDDLLRQRLARTITLRPSSTQECPASSAA